MQPPPIDALRMVETTNPKRFTAAFMPRSSRNHQSCSASFLKEAEHGGCRAAMGRNEHWDIGHLTNSMGEPCIDIYIDDMSIKYIYIYTYYVIYTCVYIYMYIYTCNTCTL